MPKEYRTIREVAGPLMLVRGVENVAYDELGEIELASGEKRRCKVLEINGNDALVQLFESATGINLSNSKVRFLGRSMELGVSEDMLGRVFDGLGRPIDGGPEILPDERRDINGLPMNPAARSYPEALTAAEYLAFEKDMHVLVIMTDITNYADALREVSAARKEVPGRRGYPGYMYTDLATLYERAGRQNGKKGSITLIPILTMPEDDKTHPIPDLTGYITEGQIILSRDLYRKGIKPPIDVLPSLSRLKDKGIGEGKTRADHANTMNQLFAAYARGKDAKELMTILGEAALTDIDLVYAKFADAFEKEYVSQGYDTDRPIEETLEIGWKLLSMLPRSELKRIDDKFLDEYYGKQ